MFWIHCLLSLGSAAHQHITLVRERDYTGRRAFAFVVLYDNWVTAFHDGYAAVCCTQIDADDSAHADASRMPMYL